MSHSKPQNIYFYSDKRRRGSFSCFFEKIEIVDVKGTWSIPICNDKLINGTCEHTSVNINKIYFT